MIKQNSPPPSSISKGEKVILIISSTILVITLPMTYVFFLLPLLGIPVVVLAILVFAGVIRNTIAIRGIEVIAILSALVAVWLTSVLLNWQAQ